MVYNMTHTLYSVSFVTILSGELVDNLCACIAGRVIEVGSDLTV